MGKVKIEPPLPRRPNEIPTKTIKIKLSQSILYNPISKLKINFH
jgi:hypothetical protein